MKSWEREAADLCQAGWRARAIFHLEQHHVPCKISSNYLDDLIKIRYVASWEKEARERMIADDRFEAIRIIQRASGRDFGNASLYLDNLLLMVANGDKIDCPIVAAIDPLEKLASSLEQLIGLERRKSKNIKGI